MGSLSCPGDRVKSVRDIRQRVLEYSLRAIKLYEYLQRGKASVGRILSGQYLRAATSIGANVEEAHAGESRADFIHKFGIAQKEATESLYWLRLLADSGTVPRHRLAPLIRETEEIYAVITKIIVTAKRKQAA